MSNPLVRIKTFYANLSILKKIYFPNIIIISLLILLSGYIANHVASELMLKRIVSNTQQSLDIIMQSLDSALNDIETGAERVASDPVVQAVLTRQIEPDQMEGLDQYFLVNSVLDKIMYLRGYIDSISVYRLDGTMAGAGFLSHRQEIQHKQLAPEFINMVSDSKGRKVWTDPGTLPYTLEYPEDSGPTLFRIVQRGNVGENVGILEMKMNESIFSRLYSHLDYGKTGRFIVVNRQRMLVFPETNDYGLYNQFLRNRYVDWLSDINSEGKITTFGREQFVVISNHLERLGWLIIGMVPLNELMDYSRRMTYSIYLIGLVSIIFELLFSFWMSQAISKPIKSLSDSMSDAAQGDLQIRARVSGNDEIGLLAGSFNNMVQRIAGLVDQVYHEQKRQRELELLALQSQINPHFLYNSLESLCALSQLGRNEDSYRLGKSLSMFYRGVLSEGRPVVTIGEEISTLKNYMAIQEIRYQDKFDFILDVEEKILDQKIIKLSLQPLVENSIYHGLKSVRRKGRIWVTGRLIDDIVSLQVVDNGQGFDEQRIRMLVSARAPDEDDRGFGMTSVDQRIKLFFGEEYGLSFRSRPGHFAKVIVRLPFISEIH